MEKKKTIFFVVLTVVTFLLALLAANVGSFTELKDACVDAADGDVAICYYGSFVKVYNREGELIFSKSLNTEGGGGMYVQYIDSYLYVYLDRPNQLLVYDKDYNLLPESENKSIYSSYRASFESNTWDEWDKRDGGMYYRLGDLEYCYEKSPFWKNIFKNGECRLFVRGANGEEITIYESKSK